MDAWMYDEFKHCGVDYSDATHAEGYDDQHQKFRNYEQEFAGMLAFLDLQDPATKTAIDLGCGTGATAMYAAKRLRLCTQWTSRSSCSTEQRKGLLEASRMSCSYMPGS